MNSHWIELHRVWMATDIVKFLWERNVLWLNFVLHFHFHKIENADTNSCEHSNANHWSADVNSEHPIRLIWLYRRRCCYLCRLCRSCYWRGAATRCGGTGCRSSSAALTALKSTTSNTVTRLFTGTLTSSGRGTGCCCCSNAALIALKSTISNTVTCSSATSSGRGTGCCCCSSAALTALKSATRCNGGKDGTGCCFSRARTCAV